MTWSEPAVVSSQLVLNENIVVGLSSGYNDAINSVCLWPAES